MVGTDVVVFDGEFNGHSAARFVGNAVILLPNTTIDNFEELTISF